MRRTSQTLTIAEDLQRRVRICELLPGTAIPSYRQLASTHGVSVSTVQRALLLLKGRGIVVGRPGCGVYVAEPPATDHPAGAGSE